MTLKTGCKRAVDGVFVQVVWGEIDQIAIIDPVSVREVEPMVPDTLCEAARTKMPENYWLTRI